MQAAPLPTIDLLHPLSAFFADLAADDLGVEELDPRALPEPYRRLLVHDRDMTSTLEGFFDDRLVLRQLARRRRGELLWRRVALLGESSGLAAEYGAIKIHLDAFPKAARREILEGHRPLGAILTVHAVEYRSCPQAFLRLRPETEMQALFALTRPVWLYGRQNVLRTRGGDPLAEVIEILPPLPVAEDGGAC